MAGGMNKGIKVEQHGHASDNRISLTYRCGVNCYQVAKTFGISIALSTNITRGTKWVGAAEEAKQLLAYDPRKENK